MSNRESKLTKLSNDIYNDIGSVRDGNLATDKANTICKLVNAVCKVENITLQYTKINKSKTYSK